MSCVILFRDIGGIPVDVVIKESVEAGMEIPSHPVETGAKISDHAWRTPTTLSLECANQDVTGTYEDLFSVMKKAEPFSIITGFTLFENMLIEKLQPERDSTTGSILKFTCNLREVIRVSSQSTSTQGKAGGKDGDKRGQEISNRGQVQALPLDSLDVVQ
jgi:hypothetical protein